jgi:biopolymer transport protein TolR
MMSSGGGPVSRRGGNRRAPMSEINVTPLVDVMLVLLIIFMVAAPLLVAGVPVNLPDSRAKALDQEKQPVSISIDGNGQIYVDDDAIPRNELRRALNGIVSDNQGEPPQILLRADRALSYGTVMTVMGELNGAGLNKVALVTAGTEEKK